MIIEWPRLGSPPFPERSTPRSQAPTPAVGAEGRLKGIQCIFQNMY